MVLLAKPRRRARPLPKSPRVGQEPAQAENLPLSFQGKPVDSKEEGRTIVALLTIGWSFTYKREYFGGRSTPGGVEVDFLVYTPVLPTPMRLQTRYYHLLLKDGLKDIFDYAKLQRIPGLGPVVDLWDHEVTSVDHAVRSIIRLLGRPG